MASGVNFCTVPTDIDSNQPLHLVNSCLQERKSLLFSSASEWMLYIMQTISCRQRKYRDCPCNASFVWSCLSEHISREIIGVVAYCYYWAPTIILFDRLCSEIILRQGICCSFLQIMRMSAGWAICRDTDLCHGQTRVIHIPFFYLSITDSAALNILCKLYRYSACIFKNTRNIISKQV